MKSDDIMEMKGLEHFKRRKYFCLRYWVLILTSTILEFENLLQRTIPSGPYPSLQS